MLRSNVHDSRRDVLTIGQAVGIRGEAHAAATSCCGSIATDKGWGCLPYSIPNPPQRGRNWGVSRLISRLRSRPVELLKIGYNPKWASWDGSISYSHDVVEVHQWRGYTLPCTVSWRTPNLRIEAGTFLSRVTSKEATSGRGYYCSESSSTCCLRGRVAEDADHDVILGCCGLRNIRGSHLHASAFRRFFSPT